MELQTARANAILYNNKILYKMFFTCWIVIFNVEIEYDHFANAILYLLFLKSGNQSLPNHPNLTFFAIFTVSRLS